MKPRAALLLIAPACVVFLFSFAAPLLMVGRMSFYNVRDGHEVFVGLANYVKAVADPYFRKSFANVFWLVLFIAPFGIGIPYKISLFLQRFDRRTQSAGRFIAYVPSFTAGLIMGLLWRWLLARGGMINQIFDYIGLPAVAWFGQPWPARIAVAMVSLSGGCGGFVILFSAVILSIPKELKEAAIIDGATERQYRSMVLRPLLMPTILLALLLSITGLMLMWEVVYVLFPTGGPLGAATTPVYEVFTTAFMYSRSNLAAAKGILLLLVVAIVITIQKQIERLTAANR